MTVQQIVENSTPQKQSTLVFTLFDRVAGEHGPLFQAPSLALAWRSVEKLFASGEIAKADVDLVCHGVFDHGQTPHESKNGYQYHGGFSGFSEPAIYNTQLKEAVN